MIHHALRLHLDSAALIANWRWLQRSAGVAAGAAVKADGYGLGAREVAARLGQALATYRRHLEKLASDVALDAFEAAE